PKKFPGTRCREYSLREQTSRLLRMSQNDFARPPVFPKRPIRLSKNEIRPGDSDRDENHLRASTTASPERPPAWQSPRPPACNRSSAAAQIRRLRVSCAR